MKQRNLVDVLSVLRDATGAVSQVIVCRKYGIKELIIESSGKEVRHRALHTELDPLAHV